MAQEKIGISQIAIQIPEYFISLKELCQKRKIPPEYALEGLGVIESRIPYKNSLQNLAVEVLKKINLKGIERFFVATESDPDASKPLGIKILSALGKNKIPFQCKFACLGGVEALILASEYVESKGKPAVILCVDRSIYHPKDPKAELTQGCAAVALRIEKNPKILILDYKHIGQYAQDIDDFKVPPSVFPFPQVQGELTKPAFLECLKKAFEDWEKNYFQKKGKNILDFFDFFIMHTPFPKIVEWACAMFWRHLKLKKKDHLGLSQCLKNPKLFGEYKKEIDKTRSLPDFKEFFEKKVKPSLKYNPFVGNSYTCSIFVSLLGVLEKAKKNQIIGISGYGSGAGSIFLKGIVVKNHFKSDLEKQIQNKKKLSPREYENWRKNIGHSKFS